MARPQRPWFRFYTEALHDPKLRRLPANHRWVWVAVLAAARQSCVPGRLMASERQPLDESDMADLAAVPVKDVRKAMAAFEAAGMLNRDEDGAWFVAKWAERQFESDDITERTRRHRSRERSEEPLRNVPTSFPGTPPETETDTEPKPAIRNTHHEPVDKSGGGGLMKQAAVLVAEAECARRQANGDPIGNPGGYVRSRTKPLLREHEHYWRTVLESEPDATAQQLADSTKPQVTSPVDGQQQAARIVQEQHMAELARLTGEPPDPQLNTSAIADIRAAMPHLARRPTKGDTLT